MYLSRECYTQYLTEIEELKVYQKAIKCHDLCDHLSVICSNCRELCVS